MIDALVLLVLGALVLIFVAAPLLRSDATQVARVSRALGEVADLQSRNDMLLASLRDLEDDRATGKLTEEDYESLHSQLTAQAVEVLKQLDAATEREEQLARTAPGPVAVEQAPAADSDR